MSTGGLQTLRGSVALAPTPAPSRPLTATLGRGRPLLQRCRVSSLPLPSAASRPPEWMLPARRPRRLRALAALRPASCPSPRLRAPQFRRRSP
eukprot:884518-Pleurochrysis_carterae.AAC.1